MTDNVDRRGFMTGVATTAGAVATGSVPATADQPSEPEPAEIVEPTTVDHQQQRVVYRDEGMIDASRMPTSPSDLGLSDGYALDVMNCTFTGVLQITSSWRRSPTISYCTFYPTEESEQEHEPSNQAAIQV